ncbi:trafficking regulator of GLUT4 (SLC2A4) 1b [Chanos chanos]|uniref:Trafficking regulator of GLUT4 (SLC2A4) 1b n=1 Tax=Chanos chanos TaxID=29144 RepID=A0A6J2W6C5_CHACN|nr:trafficking regulator of GLUT4 1-like [Chanos chanos]
MAINTDAAFPKDALNETGASHPSDFNETHKLLSVATTEPTEGYKLKSSNSPRGSVKSLNVDQKGQKSPLRSPSASNITVPPVSPSLSQTRLSFSRQSPAPNAPEPPSFLWLAVLSCFCPSPISLFALYFAHTSRSLVLAGDLDGAKKLGRRALFFSLLAIVVGLAILLYLGLSITTRKSLQG